jgi:hypothetical protein
MKNEPRRAPFRFLGREVFPDLRTSTPKSVPDATQKEIDTYGHHMERMFGNRRLPAVLYKGEFYPERNIGDFVVVR